MWSFLFWSKWDNVIEVLPAVWYDSRMGLWVQIRLGAWFISTLIFTLYVFNFCIEIWHENIHYFKTTICYNLILIAYKDISGGSQWKICYTFNILTQFLLFTCIITLAYFFTTFFIIYMSTFYFKKCWCVHFLKGGILEKYTFCTVVKLTFLDGPDLLEKVVYFQYFVKPWDGKR